ncbi:MAG: TIM barrel protein [Pirellulaceae bacterium]
MSEPVSSSHANSSQLGRRELLAYSAAFGSAFLAAQGIATGDEPAAEVPRTKPVRARAGQRRYDMKKSINMWAFPYPDTWSLKECLELAKDAGFDGVEINFALEGDFSAESSQADIRAIRKMADDIGIEISGVCSFLFWPYALTHNDPERRAKEKNWPPR